MGQEVVTYYFTLWPSVLLRGSLCNKKIRTYTEFHRGSQRAT